MKHSNITVSSGKLQFAELIKAHFYTPFGVPCEHPLPLPVGKVAKRGEDGEGIEKGCKTLSVTCGDSSPKGRAKGLHPVT